MIRFIIEKLMQKKWMVISLFIGCVLFISITTLSPIYKHGALQKMLTDRLEAESIETQQYPMLAMAQNEVFYYKKEPATCVQKTETDAQSELQKLTLPYLFDVIICKAAPQTYASNIKNASDKIYQLGFAYLPGMEEHISIVSGEKMSETYKEGEPIRVIVSKSAFQKSRLTIGEQLTFDRLRDENGDKLIFEIAGVFEQEDFEDPFWVDSAESYEKYCFVSKDVFYEQICPGIAVNDQAAVIDNTVWRLYDYERIKYEESKNLFDTICSIESENIIFPFREVLAGYIRDSRKVETTMRILQLPTILLITLFIYMVAAKMLAMEQNEIAVLKSRGVYSSQILMTYLLQSCVIAGAAMIFGLLNACVLAKLVGLSNAFMEFVLRRSLKIALTKEVWICLFLSFAFCVCVMTIPVIPKCRITVVQQKRMRSNGAKAVWKKYYFDVIGLLISGYLFYNFHHQMESIKQRVRSGESVDPTLFLGSSLFIFSASLFLTRMIPVFVSMIYKIRKKKWGISSYTAFLQSIRNQEKQSFMMIFLSATVALGIFNANTARTINVNEETNLRYEDGADIVMKEEFKSNLAAIKFAISKGNSDPGAIVYTQPEEIKYQKLDDYISASAKVYHLEDISVKGTSDFTGNGNRTAPSFSLDRGCVTLMGISTKEFGETAYLPSYLGAHHWYEDLNKMAVNPYGVLVSSNMKKQFGLREGDCILYDVYDVLGRNTGFGKGVIVGFVDYFPGYLSQQYAENADGSYALQDHYLIVASFDLITSKFGIQPYERWYKNKKTNDYIYSFLEEEKICLQAFSDADNDVVRMKNDPVFQETNGLLTIGFLVSLLVCAVGFLIFQIMGMKERELNFGVYRAMGLTSEELQRMLLYEQLFTTLPTILGGIGTGMIATKLFIPLIDVTYASGTSKLLPARIIVSVLDMLQLSMIVLIAFSLCMWIIGRIIKRMQIAQALKLGEE